MISKILVKEGTHMASMKIVKFSRPPVHLSSYVQNSSTSLTFDVQFWINAPLSPHDIQSIKRSHNPRCAWGKIDLVLILQ